MVPSRLNKILPESIHLCRISPGRALCPRQGAEGPSSCTEDEFIEVFNGSHVHAPAALIKTQWWHHLFWRFRITNLCFPTVLRTILLYFCSLILFLLIRWWSSWQGSGCWFNNVSANAAEWLAVLSFCMDLLSLDLTNSHSKPLPSHCFFLLLILVLAVTEAVGKAKLLSLLFAP